MMWLLLSMLLLLAKAEALTPSCQDVHHLSNNTNRSYARLDCYCRADKDGVKMYAGDLRFLSSHVSRAKKVRHGSDLDHVQVFFKYCQSIRLKSINMAAILPRGKLKLNLKRTSIIRIVGVISITPRTSLIIEAAGADEFGLKEAKIKCFKCKSKAKLDNKLQIRLNQVDKVSLESVRVEIPMRFEVRNAENVLLKDSYFEILAKKAFGIQKSNQVEMVNNEFLKVAPQAFDIDEVSKLVVKWNAFNISSTFAEPSVALSLSRVDETILACNNNNNFYCGLDVKTFLLPIFLLLCLMVLSVKLCLCLSCILGLAQKCLLSRDKVEQTAVLYKQTLMAPKASILKKEPRKNSLESRPELEQGRSYVRISNVVVDKNGDNEENEGVVKASITLGGAWPKEVTTIKAFTTRDDDTIVSQVDHLEHIDDDNADDNNSGLVGKRRRRKATPPARFARKKGDKKRIGDLDKKKNKDNSCKSTQGDRNSGVATSPSPPGSTGTGSSSRSGGEDKVRLAKDESGLAQGTKRLSQTSLGRYTTV